MCVLYKIWLCEDAFAYQCLCMRLPRMSMPHVHIQSTIIVTLLLCSEDLIMSIHLVAIPLIVQQIHRWYEE